LCDAVFDLAARSPGVRLMPPDYFMFTEVHFGGCGCYTQTDARLTSKCIQGAAIGFR
jgi:hypothetical protein